MSCIWAVRALAGVFLLLSAANLLAGGGGFNVVVVVNTNSSDSLQLGNYYCERRGVPAQNVLRIGWTGGNVNWARSDFEGRLRTPLLALLNSRQLSNQVEYVLLSMDIPYRVYNGGTALTLGTNGTTSALFYGFKADACVLNCPGGFSSCTLGSGADSDYAGSEGLFRQTPPISAVSNSWLTMMLTSSNLTQAMAIVDRGVASDASYPTQSVYLIHYEGDAVRGSRHYQYNDAIFDNQVRGAARVVRVDASSPNGLGYQLGSQFGLSTFNLSPGLFAPGAMADNLTSFGGFLFESFGQTTVLNYLIAGATASHGTVAEPCAYLEKFAASRNYFYQARGFNIAEAYYLSLTNPYQGIIVGEPLAAPFAVSATGSWSNLPAGAVLTGTTNLSGLFVAADTSRPLQQVDLFLDGRLFQTVTNLAPRQGNRLFVTLNGFATNYTVPANATLQTVAAGLVSRLNGAAYSTATKVTALAHGDRLEMRSTDTTRRGSELSVTVSNDIGTANLLTVGLVASRPAFLDTPAAGYRNCIVSNAVQASDTLQLTVTRTNGLVTTVAVTNSPGNTDTSILVQALMTAINTTPDLMGADGVQAVDFFSYTPYGLQSGEFNLRARSPGWPEARLTVSLAASGNLAVTPGSPQTLEENINDLRPRNHLYVTAGFTNLPLNFNFNTVTQADGFHELSAVAYEGTHVRTQTRITQAVQIQNSPLSAVFTCAPCDTNTALETTLQFSVVANTNTISRIELFSTGGSWGVSSNQAAAAFSVVATNLGQGLHPFYAVVTRNDGQQYRTETKWLRLVNEELPFALSASGPPVVLSWPATAGRRYDILSTPDLADAFMLRASVFPTNSLGTWMETNNGDNQRFYRLRSAP